MVASNPNLFYLLQSEDIRSPIIELGGARGGVRGNGLRLLDRSPVLQVGRDSRCPAIPGGIGFRPAVRGFVKIYPA